MKIFRIGCIVAVILLFIVFVMPLPFISSLWEDEILRRRMADDVSRRVVGLHTEEIILMLGEPDVKDRHRRDDLSALVYRLRDPEHERFWQHLIIFYDENDIAVNTSIGNPLHF